MKRCEAFYSTREARGLCRCLPPDDSASRSVDALLELMQPNTTSTRTLATDAPAAAEAAHAVAVVLRGHAFRGEAADLRQGGGGASVLEAQSQCSRSVRCHAPVI